jgi:prepilin-type processing-associated H-X9-DG protein
MYCPKCGTENPDDVQLCRSCSWVLTSISITAQNPNAKTSGLAITSLVLGILSIFTFFLTAIPAIILGIIGIFKIEKSAGQLKGKGLAIAGIAVPGASLLFMVPIMMIAIMIPALTSARAQAQRVACASTLKQLGVAMQIYAEDNNHKYPMADKWCDLLKPYYMDEKVLICPSAGQGRCHYAINPQAEPNSPPDVVLLFETKGGWNQAGGPDILSTDNHKGEGCNVLFNDGHVEFVKIKDINNLKWMAE